MSNEFFVIFLILVVLGLIFGCALIQLICCAIIFFGLLFVAIITAGDSKNDRG